MGRPVQHGRIEKKCNPCGLIKNFELFRKKNNALNKIF